MRESDDARHELDDSHKQWQQHHAVHHQLQQQQHHQSNQMHQHEASSYLNQQQGRPMASNGGGPLMAPRYSNDGSPTGSYQHKSSNSFYASNSPNPIHDMADQNNSFHSQDGQLSPRSGASSASSQPCKLFIGGLSYDTTDESLLEYFSTFGQVASAVVLRDPTSSRSRGFGFVTFCTLKAANTAMSCTQHMVDGRKVEAKFAVPRSSNTQQKEKVGGGLVPPGGSIQNQNNLNNMNRSMNGMLMNEGVNSGGGSFRHQDGYGGGNENDFDHNNSGAATASDVAYARLNRSFYSESALPHRDNNSVRGSSGGGGDRFDRRAMSADTVESMGNYNPQQQHHHHHHMDDDITGNGSIGASGSGGGIVVDKVFVGGVLYATGHESLRLYFERFGVVRTAEVIYNRDTKKSRGFGFVVFQDCVSVQRVIAAQAVQPLVIDGKQVEVKECVARQDASGTSTMDQGQGRLQQHSSSSSGIGMHDGHHAGGSGRMRGNSTITSSELIMGPNPLTPQGGGGRTDNIMFQQRPSPRHQQLSPTSPSWGNVEGNGYVSGGSNASMNAGYNNEQDRRSQSKQTGGTQMLLNVRQQQQSVNSVPRLRSGSFVSPSSSSFTQEQQHVMGPSGVGSPTNQMLPKPIGSPLHSHRHEQSFFPPNNSQQHDNHRRQQRHPHQQQEQHSGYLARTVSAPERDFMTPAYRALASGDRDDSTGFMNLAGLRESMSRIEIENENQQYQQHVSQHNGSMQQGRESEQQNASGLMYQHRGYEGGGIGPGLSVVGSEPGLRRASSVGTGLFYNPQEEENNSFGNNNGHLGTSEIPPLSLNGKNNDDFDNDGGGGEDVRVLYQQQSSPQQQQRHRLGSQHSQHSNGSLSLSGIPRPAPLLTSGNGMDDCVGSLGSGISSMGIMSARAAPKTTANNKFQPLGFSPRPTARSVDANTGSGTNGDVVSGTSRFFPSPSTQLHTPSSQLHTSFFGNGHASTTSSISGREQQQAGQNSETPLPVSQQQQHQLQHAFDPLHNGSTGSVGNESTGSIIREHSGASSSSVSSRVIDHNDGQSDVDSVGGISFPSSSDVDDDSNDVTSL